MDSKKRSLQVTEKKNCRLKCQQKSLATKKMLRTCEENVEELYFSLLPNEVLLLIYKYLSVVDLLSLSELNNQRLTDLTYTIREANFSSCRRENSLMVANFFNRTRVKYIQKLNFNYFFYIKPCDLRNFICKCKNLTTLSVIDCGLNFYNIVDILKSCTNLEELAWKEEGMEPMDICLPNLKRVYLFCDFPFRERHSDSMQIFSQVENVWVNQYSDSLSALPFISPWSCVTGLATKTLGGDPEIFPSCSIYFAYYFMERCKGIGDGHPLITSRMSSCPPYLQMTSTNEDILSLSSGSFKAYSTVAIILTPEFISLSENLIKCMKEIAGAKLKQLSVLLSEHNFHESENQPSKKEDIAFLCDKSCGFLEKVFLTSKNITVLNLIPIHFSTESPICAIMQLPYLKVLHISSCVFNSSANFEYLKKLGLSAVVSSCLKIEDFVLNCCVDSQEKLTDEELECMKNWTHLKHLSIYSITFRTSRFLRKVADSCMNLLGLSLITVAPQNCCLYIGDVIYLLKTAKNLRLIRINDEKFNPMFECFWPAIGSAVNLECICISTKIGVYVEKKFVIDEIKKLKYLHLFHFTAPRATDRLYFEVSNSMRDHGVKNTKISSNCTNYCFTNLSDPVKHYHRPPGFCCRLLHLKDFDIFDF